MEQLIQFFNGLLHMHTNIHTFHAWILMHDFPENKFEDYYTYMSKYFLSFHKNKVFIIN